MTKEKFSQSRMPASRPLGLALTAPAQLLNLGLGAPHGSLITEEILSDLNALPPSKSSAASTVEFTPGSSTQWRPGSTLVTVSRLSVK